MDIYASFVKELRDINVELKCNVSAKSLTTFKTGGNIRLCAYPSERSELAECIKLCKKYGIDHFILGRGSNSLISDNGYNGVAILTERMNKIRSEDLDDGTVRIYADCGVPITFLASYAANASLSGLEFAYGIPGSVGGAVFMNAGAYGGQMSDITVSSQFYDIENDVFGEFCEGKQRFGYRQSIYSDNVGKTVIVGAVMVLRPSDKDSVLSKCRQNMESRKEKQPLEYPSAGSVFKRRQGYYMGKVIEDCGLKGYSVGGAKVSEKHAGFIINYDGATTSDVVTLIDYIRKTVYCKYGFIPECEIRMIK